MECNTDKNLKNCNCTYTSCSKRGKCCDCILYHRKMGQLPACYFDAEAEATYDRSVEHFMRCQKK